MIDFISDVVLDIILTAVDAMNCPDEYTKRILDNQVMIMIFQLHSYDQNAAKKLYANIQTKIIYDSVNEKFRYQH